ncbi:MAG: RHS repeat-associated core domain-containing protein [Candidatus Thiodiazotropha endolucinida]
MSDAYGQLSSLTYEWSDGTIQSLISNLQTLPFGPVKAFDYGNGLSLTRGFDQDYQLISQTIPGILQSSYQHDPVGNITDWQDLLSTGQDQLFDYDALYRLTSANGAYGDTTYTYDATGNRLSLTLDGSTETYSYVPSSHRLQQILGSVTDSRSYDAAGNTIQSLIGSYAYDDTNRMVRFSKTGTTATYAYNGKGERISKNVDGTITRFRYAPAGQLLGEYDQNGQAIREYITLEGQPVALIVTDPVTTLSSVYYLHTDHLGAVVKATDSTQTLVWDAERKPFGERSVITAQIEMPLGFPGQYFDEETGNYYNYFRDYDPSTGRYLQSDPIGLEGGINTYAYVAGNPLILIDPNGLAYSQQGEHGIPNDSKPSPCKDACFANFFGVGTAAGATAVTAGQPLVPYPRSGFDASSSTGRTSVASKWGRAAFGNRRMPRFPTPTNAGAQVGTASVGGAVGRIVPGVGYTVLAYQYAKLLKCLAECDDCK